jgi:hypothetical protein
MFGRGCYCAGQGGKLAELHSFLMDDVSDVTPISCSIYALSAGVTACPKVLSISLIDAFALSLACCYAASLFAA